MRRSTVKELHRSGEKITRRLRSRYALTTLSEGSPLKAFRVSTIYDQKGVLRVKGREHLIWTPPPSVVEDEGGGMF